MRPSGKPSSLCWSVQNSSCSLAYLSKRARRSPNVALYSKLPTYSVTEEASIQKNSGNMKCADMLRSLRCTDNGRGLCGIATSGLEARQGSEARQGKSQSVRGKATVIGLARQGLNFTFFKVLQQGTAVLAKESPDCGGEGKVEVMELVIGFQYFSHPDTSSIHACRGAGNSWRSSREVLIPLIQRGLGQRRQDLQVADRRYNR